VQSSLQEAGKYNITEHVLPGIANNSRYMRRTSFDPKEYFEFTVLPVITSISPNSGNVGGQYLTLSGTGFSANIKNNTVTVEGNDCKVTLAEDKKIECTLAAKDAGQTTLLSTNTSASQLNGYISGAGLKYARYVRTGSIDSLSEF
jgi:hypothetical protein